MAITQLEPAILFDSNIFLVTGERTVLIDAGTGFKVEETIKEIKRILGGRKLDVVVITHRHYDHVGGLRGIIKEFSPKVYAGSLDAVPLREGDSESTMGTSFGGTIDEMDVEDLREGDVIDLKDHRLLVIETPGHTSGSISLSDQVTGALFTGDTVFTDGIGRFDLPTASRDQLVASLQRLSGMDIHGFYPGHGPSVKEGGREYIERGLRMMEGMQ
jgi:Zn-dependent hydrolases, including glyoxylases